MDDQLLYNQNNFVELVYSLGHISQTIIGSDSETNGKFIPK